MTKNVFNVPSLIQGHVKISAGAVLAVSENRLVCMQTPNQYDYTEDGTDCQDIVNMTDPAQLAYWGQNMGAGLLFEKGASLKAEGAGTKVLVQNNVGGSAGGLAAIDPATSIHVTAGAEIEISGNTALAAIAGGGGLLLYNRATV